MVDNTNSTKVPLYSKISWVVTWILILVLLFMLGRNLISSIIFGPTTDKNDISTFYNAGFADASAEKKEMDRSGMNEENPLLRKSYTKGFQEGSDSKWQKK